MEVGKNCNAFRSWSSLGKFNSIWVIVDMLTKSAQSIPINKTYNAEKLAKLYVYDIV